MLMLNQCIFLAFFFTVIMIFLSLIMLLFSVLKIYDLKKDKLKRLLVISMQEVTHDKFKNRDSNTC